jgi:tetratricopeptide (TPR) repeat protein
MVDIQYFYAHLLDLASPWTVKVVVLEDRSERIEVHLEFSAATQFQCLHCDRYCSIVDVSPLKTWRHLDTCRKTTFLHARLPIVNCPEHGKQQLHPPWGHADSPVTLAFEQWITRLYQGFGDIKKAAHFSRMELAQLRHILRRAIEKPGEVEPRLVDAQDSSSQTSPSPPARQLSVFGQNDMTYVNQGIQAFRSLELEQAVELFQKHRSLYPKGYNVTSRLAAAEFLLQGIREAPAEPCERPAHLCRLWDSFEDYLKSEPAGRASVANRDAHAAEVKGAFFARVIEEAERCGRSDSSSLQDGAADASLQPGDIPRGYILLQAGRFEDAIQSLQNCIAGAPHHAALYGWLGDAYWLRGDVRVARQCYREACLIDPAAIDWRHLQDEDLKELKQDLLLDYGSNPDLAVAWLPSHARITGLFERKMVRVHDGLKELVDDYLTLVKSLAKKENYLLTAKLFFTGMILCENQESLKFIKKIDLIQVRRMMKQANPDLFAEFMERIAEGKG